MKFYGYIVFSIVSQILKSAVTNVLKEMQWSKSTTSSLSIKQHKINAQIKYLW